MGVCQRIPAYVLSASHDKQIVVQIVGAISKKIILIITRNADSLLLDIELRQL